MYDLLHSAPTEIDQGTQLRPFFCTVIEPGKNWVNAAALLVQSLRRNGGIYAKCPFVIYVNGYSDVSGPLLKDDDQQLLVLGNHRHPLIPHVSKVSALGLNDMTFTHLVLLDHDTIVLHLDDLSTFLTDRVHARRNYKHSLTRALGANYASTLSAPGIKPWSRIHYFNSGVVIVPRIYCRSLETQWRMWAERLAVPYRGRPIAEQIGFSMALANAKIPYQFLPMKYNETNWRPPSPDAAIIHYNAYDPINREVKQKLLWSFEDFDTFLAQTDNRFWRAHAPAIQQLLGPALNDLAEKILRSMMVATLEENVL